MASVTKDASIVSIAESTAIQGPPDPATNQPTEIPTMTLGVLIGAGTPGEQRANFMMLESDYQSLGSPGYGAAVTITIATA